MVSASKENAGIVLSDPGQWQPAHLLPNAPEPLPVLCPLSTVLLEPEIQLSRNPDKGPEVGPFQPSLTPSADARLHHTVKHIVLHSTDHILTEMNRPRGKICPEDGSLFTKKTLISRPDNIYVSTVGFVFGLFFFKHPAYIQKYTCTIQMLWHNSAIDCD